MYQYPLPMHISAGDSVTARCAVTRPNKYRCFSSATVFFELLNGVFSAAVRDDVVCAKPYFVYGANIASKISFVASNFWIFVE